MKQVIPFVKDIIFENEIKEITSIALEHNLKMENNDSIVGDFLISGNYIINNTIKEENDFEKTISFDITLDDKYDSKKVKIDIDNFYYELKDINTLTVHIDVLVSNLMYIKKDVKENIKDEIDLLRTNENIDTKEILEERKDDLKVIKNIEKEIDLKEMGSEDEKEKEEKDISKGFQMGFLDNKDNYVTYKVHIIRDDDTVDNVKEKYNIDEEELKKYNNLENITVGTKIIIPFKDE